MRQLKITKSITNRKVNPGKISSGNWQSRPVTPEKEVDLAKKIKQGDQIALETLTRLTSVLWFRLLNNIKTRVYPSVT
jgi:RNA polymerase primary sigma factor